ncbi:hypothetical protein DDE18_12560 [Nocardioides gansuensis]|uniref:ANTAR domain-containing protein n=1 Tax=Nocardioides gansuensis TaxID=2138300 RepID=A0A2T8F9H4_9ACTN|nr:hypothetical protein DDE18_12560 [Nocardioides gansuensis]
MAATEARAPLTLRLCLAFSELTHSQGGAISMGFASAERVTLSATNEAARRIEELQDVLREGPSLDASRTGEAVGGLTRAEQTRRWPMLSENLRSLDGQLVLHSYPMRPESTVLGVLTVHQSEDLGVRLPVGEAQFLADAVGIAMLGELDADAILEATFGDHTWHDQDAIATATGMVIAQLRISPADALAVLRAHAYAHDTTLVRVSEQVLARTMDFRAGNDEASR